MMTYQQILECYENQTPVILHNPDNPQSQLARKVGFIRHVYPNSEHPDQIARQTYQETMVWIIFPDCDEIFAWAHEFRVANLRNPIKINREFIHTSSNRYSGDDMTHQTGRNK